LPRSLNIREMAERDKILVTGASGFLGSRFVEICPHPERLQSVSLKETKPAELELSDIKTVVHFTGMAHRIGKTDPALYFKVNRDLTIQLATCAKEAGVEHFVFISTIKVFSEDPSNDILSIETLCEPVEPYGQSKLEAELALLDLNSDHFKVAVLRPPLVYGPGAKGNLRRLMNLVSGRFSLPFGGIDNKRSMIYRDNLLNYIIAIIEQKSNGIFLPKDDPPISTTYLVRCLRDIINRDKRIITIPPILLKVLKFVKPGVYYRLFGSLVIDNSGADQVAGYQQQVSVEEGLKLMGEGYMKSQDTHHTPHP